MAQQLTSLLSLLPLLVGVITIGSLASATRYPPITPCTDHQCQAGAVCTVKDYTDPICVCSDEECTDEGGPVCGSDGITYSNECQLNYSACKLAENGPSEQVPDLSKASDGECIVLPQSCTKLACTG